MVKINMEINEVLNYIKEGSDIDVELDGIIKCKDKIKVRKLNEDEDYIWLEEKNNQKLGINKHQIMKIEENEGIIKIYLDQLLQITLYTNI